jgi:hypothetical protein
MKVLGITAVGAIAAYLLFSFVIAPYRCNCVKGADEQAIVKAAGQPGSFFAIMTARRVLQSIEGACTSSPDLDADMIAAAALQLLSRYELAEGRYHAALRLDRRPEIYLQLGNTQLALGRRAEAEENLYRCGLFNSVMLDAVDDPSVRRRVYDRVVGAHAAMRGCDSIDAQRLRIRLSQQFGDTGAKVFATRKPYAEYSTGFLPASTTPVAITGVTSAKPSAARFWNIRNDRVGTTETDLVTYGGRNSNRLLHVASDGLGGVTRRWGMAGSGPRRVVTVAWVFLVYGEVMIGSGDGDHTQFDERSQEPGEWRLLTGISHSVPANETVIFAGPGGAEFYVASVAVFPFDERVLPQ